MSQSHYCESCGRSHAGFTWINGYYTCNYCGAKYLFVRGGTLERHGYNHEIQNNEKILKDRKRIYNSLHNVKKFNK